MKIGLVLGFALLASTANAATIWVPCEDYGIPVPHSALPHVAHVVHHKSHHRHRHAKAHHGSRTAILRKMCPVWLDTSLGGPAGAWPAGGWFEETADRNSEGFGAEAAFPSVGGVGVWGSDVAPLSPIIPADIPTFTISASTPLGFLPIPSSGPGITTPVPELSSWLLMLIGFAGLVVAGLRLRGERMGFGGISPLRVT